MKLIGRKFRSLTEIYSVLPEIDCVGRCAGTCTAIPMSNVERQRVASRGFRIPLIDVSLERTWKNHVCPALTPDKRCAVHDVRPLICRMYGVVEDIPCPFGCTVHDEMLSAEEGHWLMSEARRLGNGSTVVNRRRKENLKKRRK